MLNDLILSAYRPRELSAMLRLKLAGMENAAPKGTLEEISDQVDDITFCYTALNKVSRSFAVVIRNLPEELRDPVCIFYLVLRGLDSVEDDATFPVEQKIPLLKNFYTKNDDTDWSITGVGDSDDYRALLARYPKVSHAFQQLAEPYRNIINDICRRMGEGMAEFVERPIKTMEDYDKYCHYVAGLVGIGLSDLFAVSGKESPVLSQLQERSNSMGLFLQKTNIVRDYHEDLHLDRVFWPEDAWKKYANELNEFESDPYSERSLNCLNGLVCDALRHVPDCLEYQQQLRDPRVFRFCAIPQVMAMATLSKLYDNPMVFTSNVKIRKGLAARLMTEVRDMDALRYYIDQFATEMIDNLRVDDPHYNEMCKQLFMIKSSCKQKYSLN